MADFSYQLFIIGTLFGIIEKEKKKEKNDFFSFWERRKMERKKNVDFIAFYLF